MNLNATNIGYAIALFMAIGVSIDIVHIIVGAMVEKLGKGFIIWTSLGIPLIVGLGLLIEHYLVLVGFGLPFLFINIAWIALAIVAVFTGIKSGKRAKRRYW